LWGTFWDAFRGGASGLTDWYRRQVHVMGSRLAVSLVILSIIAVVGGWASYRWTTANVPRLLSAATTQDLGNLAKGARQSAGLAQLHQRLTAGPILANNLRATGLVMLGGLVSFGVLGIVAYMLNVGLVGGVLGVFQLTGYSPALMFAGGLLPHGVFEIPALMLAGAAVLRTGASFVMPQPGKSMGQVLLELLADCTKVLLGAVVPLLVVAALVEAYVTPSILQAILK
jgi:stage II sporulation protein M